MNQQKKNMRHIFDHQLSKCGIIPVIITMQRYADFNLSLNQCVQQLESL